MQTYIESERNIEELAREVGFSASGTRQIAYRVGMSEARRILAIVASHRCHDILVAHAAIDLMERDRRDGDRPLTS